jgi:hypothetical protein
MCFCDADLQYPGAGYPDITGITETGHYLYMGRLLTPALGRFPKAKGGNCYSKKKLMGC